MQYDEAAAADLGRIDDVKRDVRHFRSPSGRPVNKSLPGRGTPNGAVNGSVLASDSSRSVRHLRRIGTHC